MTKGEQRVVKNEKTGRFVNKYIIRNGKRVSNPLYEKAIKKSPSMTIKKYNDNVCKNENPRYCLKERNKDGSFRKYANERKDDDDDGYEKFDLEIRKYFVVPPPEKTININVYKGSDNVNKKNGEIKQEQRIPTKSLLDKRQINNRPRNDTYPNTSYTATFFKEFIELNKDNIPRFSFSQMVEYYIDLIDNDLFSTLNRQFGGLEEHLTNKFALQETSTKNKFEENEFNPVILKSMCDFTTDYFHGFIKLCIYDMNTQIIIQSSNSSVHQMTINLIHLENKEKKKESFSLCWTYIEEAYNAIQPEEEATYVKKKILKFIEFKNLYNNIKNAISNYIGKKSDIDNYKTKLYNSLNRQYDYHKRIDNIEDVYEKIFNDIIEMFNLPR